MTLEVSPTVPGISGGPRVSGDILLVSQAVNTCSEI